MAKYDLTAAVAPYLDRHLVFPLLEFLQDKQLYPDDQILKAKIELLGKTNMVDYAMDIHKSLYHTEDVPQGLVLLHKFIYFGLPLRFFRVRGGLWY
jgi:translation initiation factor 3 subunit E